MKHLFSITIALLAAATLHAANPLLERLRRVPGVSNIQTIQVDPYTETYLFDYEQRVDHANPASATFPQRVSIAHRDFNAPVVVILEGYGLDETRESELSSLFSTNQVAIEHRFFNTSVPETGIPWQHLTIARAAADHHEIIQALKQHLYPESRWISTGIGKGGQTTLFHRYFYPDDVHVSVPYVAPFNHAYIDRRLRKFLASLGKTPAQRQRLGFVYVGGQEITVRIMEFQHACFARLDRLAPRLEALAREKNMTFERAGGIERVMKLVILEYPFAFWQWNGDIGEIPGVEHESDEELFNYLVNASPPGFFSDQEIAAILPFYYAALTEIGMYAYDLSPFRSYFKREPDRRQVDFRFTIPDSIALPAFNEKQARDIQQWLETDASRMLFIYGGRDPWSATAVDLGRNDKCRKYVKADANHTCRVASFERLVRDDIVRVLSSWINNEDLDND
ncbi:MAG: peptidase [Odoribacteraceae bacterium]|nr:peptidase [Odoribacteraceae bacterium]